MSSPFFESSALYKPPVITQLNVQKDKARRKRAHDTQRSNAAAKRLLKRLEK